jgi:hypothetical protein
MSRIAKPEGGAVADRCLFIGWGNAVHGREVRALEVFNEALGLLGRMQQEGRIEGFDVAIFDPNSTLDGCVQIKGTAEQIAALRDDEEFRRNTADSLLIVDGLCHLTGHVDEGVAHMIARYHDAVEKVPQQA